MTTVFSYGAGVQSRAILHLTLEGKLPTPDLTVFCDLGAEPSDVYAAVEEDGKAARLAGMRFEVVKTDLTGHMLDRKPRQIPLPAFTLDMRGEAGMLKRTCTSRFKVEPVYRAIRQAFKPTAKQPVTLWMGISTDEAHRAKAAPVRYAQTAFPLLDLNWSRDDCLAFLTERGIKAVKSACVYCPFMSPARWVELRRTDPQGWREAVAVDDAIRERRKHKGLACFVHPARVPLEQAVELPITQVDLWGNECEGACGL
jgi:3'-phosphoadenosine 5'-phosphosulfate sulfotransferase (PAPS reductase)/FAD synthetase